uniref:CUB domain-containing protein n=1 Tax=Scylla olivacea TaxID=85551 RepID=A0A0P4W812_SCYOL
MQFRFSGKSLCFKIEKKKLNFISVKESSRDFISLHCKRNMMFFYFLLAHVLLRPGCDAHVLPGLRGVQGDKGEEHVGVVQRRYQHHHGHAVATQPQLPRRETQMEPSGENRIIIHTQHTKHNHPSTSTPTFTPTHAHPNNTHYPDLYQGIHQACSSIQPLSFASLSFRQYPFTRLCTLQVPVCGQKGGQRMLTLSPCVPGEFTCDDGSCIAFSKRCDLKFDCIDKTDESFCDIVNFPGDYRSRLPPRPGEWACQGKVAHPSYAINGCSCFQLHVKHLVVPSVSRSG